MIFYRIFLTSLCLAVFACGSHNNEIAVYRAEAAHYCAVHSADYWVSNHRLMELNTLTPTEKQKVLIKEIRLAVKTPEMNEIIFTEGANISAQDFYPFLQKRIPELTQEAFICPAIAEFYVAQ